MRPYYSIYYPNVKFELTAGPGEGVYFRQPYIILVKTATPTHFGDAQPDVLVPPRVSDAEHQLFGFVGVDVEPLEIVRLAAGVDRVNFLSVAKDVQAPGYLSTLVEGD